jgi:crotonobetainyl-CoA:carnitine CoA-transferase CaiB-like acyl-CoA transferase
MAALVYRTIAGQGQYIDASIHEACALTTESAIANYIYRGEVLHILQKGPLPPDLYEEAKDRLAVAGSAPRAGAE